MKIIYEKQGVLEITRGWDFTIKVSQYHDSYTLILSLIYFTFYIRLPNFGYDFNNWDRSWGLYWYGSSLNFVWGKKCYFFRAPWSWVHVRHEVMYPRGLAKPSVPWDEKDGRVIEKYPYTYILKNGDIQECEATVYMEEREWCWKWFTWFRYPRKICRSISVSFSTEIGESTGSYKGGCVGCGYDVKLGESILDTLRRMEKKRIFN